MMKSIAGAMGMLALGALLVACATKSSVTQEGNSGFLRDYSRLKESRTGSGQTIRAWVSPKLTPANYNALLVEPIVFHPEPRPTEQVSAEALQQMLAYSNDLLKRTLGERFRVVNQAGPGVLRFRVGFTSVAAQGEGLQPYQYIPIALVATMASRAAKGGAPQRAIIIAELEGLDSVSGELLGMRVRVGTGERLAKIGGEKTITLETVKPLLDEMAGDAFPELAKYVKPK